MYFVRVLRLNRKGVIEMFSSDFFWSQVWKVIVGAVICIIGVIVYTILQLVDITVMYVSNYLSYWLFRALLLVVGLWAIGQTIHWYRGWGATEVPEETDSE